MIAAVKGTLVAKRGDRILVATAGGVSYEIAVPLGVLERLPQDGGEVTLRTVPVVREDGWALYGFDTEREQEIFQRLLLATGVGPRLALALVSTLGGDRVVRAVHDADLGALCAVPGVGKKTAERMVLELKDRLKELAAADGKAPSAPAPAEQALQALVNLGYNAQEAERAVRETVAVGGAETVDLIKGALQLLTKLR